MTSSILPLTRRGVPFCFRSKPVEGHCTLPVSMDAQSARALAQLVPLLGCGEEAAALAFDGLARRSNDQVARHALRQIAQEETVHDGLLRQLAMSLPEVDVPGLRAKARRFHINLGRGDDSDHLARIAAIDAGVCMVLSRLLRAGRPISKNSEVTNLLTRIRSDEARHVAISRALAVRSGTPKSLNTLADGARSALADVLSLASDAFETLEVDPDTLSADLRAVPRGLFTQ